jgi:hypothetical protein
MHEKKKFPKFKLLVTNEILKTLNLDTFKDRNTKVHHNVIIKFLCFYFQLQWKHKRKATRKKGPLRITQKNSNCSVEKELGGHLKAKGCLVQPFFKNGIWSPTLRNFLASFRTGDWFHCLSQDIFCSLLTCKDTRSCNFYVILLGSGFML